MTELKILTSLKDEDCRLDVVDSGDFAVISVSVVECWVVKDSAVEGCGETDPPLVGPDDKVTLSLTVGKVDENGFAGVLKLEGVEIRVE